MGKIVDLTGQKFGLLTVVKDVGRKDRKVAWLCRCDCGNTHITTGNLLRGGKVKSCGCLNYARRPSHICKNPNITYDLTNEYGICTLIKYDCSFLFDKEDYDLVRKYTWHVDSNGYVYHGGRKLLHRMITRCPSGLVVDHINHNILDNRKCNLRICTYQQNSMNMRRKNLNISGCKGVYYDKTAKRYLASIGYNNRSIYLGSYKTFEEAAKIRIEKEKELYGEYMDVHMEVL